MDTEKMNQAGAQAKGAAKKYWKKGLAAVVALALIGGAGVAIDIQREQSEHAAKAAARSQLVAAQAARENVTLISEDEAKAAAAEAVGIDESALTFKNVGLENLAMQGKEGKEKDKKQEKEKKAYKHAGDRHEDERDGDHDGWHENENHDGDHSFDGMHEQGDHRMAPSQGRMQDPADGQPQAAPQGQPPQPPQMQPQSADSQQAQNGQPQRPNFRFHPAYKIACEHGGVKYHVMVDAVSGQVMMCDVA